MKNQLKTRITSMITLVFALVVFAMTPIANADRCEDAWIKILPEEQMPIANRSVLLEPGDTVWDNYTCKSCQTFQSMRPSPKGQQECPNCGQPHTNEPLERPEHFTKDGRIYLIELGTLINHGDRTGAFARSGKGWICPYCTQHNFQVEVSCPGCGGSAPSWILTPGKFKNYSEANPATPVSGVEIAAEKSMYTYKNKDGSIEIDEKYVAPAGAPAFTAPAKPVGTGLPLDIQNPKKPKFLRTKTGMALMSAAVAGAIGFVWWGTEAYTLPAEVTQISGNTAYVSYVDKSGNSTTVDFTPNGKNSSIKTWRIGDKLTLHFRNLGGVKGGEGFDGTVMVPGKKN